MTMRGVRKAGRRTITSAVRGIMQEAATRAEAMALIHGSDDATGPAAAPDGSRQRHARLVLRRRPLRSTPTPPIAHGRRAARRGCRHPRHRRRVHPARAPPGRWSRRSSPASSPSSRELAAAGAVVSVDTMRAEVAAAAIEAGASIVNDVSGGLADPLILAWWRGPRRRTSPCTGAAHSRPDADARRVRRPGGVVDAVVDELGERVEAALAAGIDRRPAGARPRPGFRQDGRPQLGAVAPASTGSRRSATRCWSARAASRSSAACWPARTARRARSTTARTPTSPSPLCWPSGGVGVRVHDVRASTDAVRVWRGCGRGGKAQ